MQLDAASRPASSRFAEKSADTAHGWRFLAVFGGIRIEGAKLKVQKKSQGASPSRLADDGDGFGGLGPETSLVALNFEL